MEGTQKQGWQFEGKKKKKNQKNPRTKQPCFPHAVTNSSSVGLRELSLTIKRNRMLALCKLAAACWSLFLFSIFVLLLGEAIVRKSGDYYPKKQSKSFIFSARLPIIHSLRKYVAKSVSSVTVTMHRVEIISRGVYRILTLGI